MSNFSNYFENLNKQLDKLLDDNSNDSDYVTFNYKIETETTEYPCGYTAKVKATPIHEKPEDEEHTEDPEEDDDDESYEIDWDDCCEDDDEDEEDEECGCCCTEEDDEEDDDDGVEYIDIDTGIDILCNVSKDGDISLKVFSIPDAESARKMLPDVAHAVGDIILSLKPRISKD